MPIYWTMNQLPELQDVPPDERRHILEYAIETIPATWRNAAVALGPLFVLATLGLVSAVRFGQWIHWVWIPIAVFTVDILFLNLVRWRIRELLQDRDRREEELRVWMED